jgi:hypothetical protein
VGYGTEACALRATRALIQVIAAAIPGIQDVADRFPASHAMENEIERLHAYLEALDRARTAVDEARRLYPDMDLDHAVDRLGAFVKEGAERLHRLEANPI